MSADKNRDVQKIYRCLLMNFAIKPDLSSTLILKKKKKKVKVMIKSKKFMVITEGLCASDTKIRLNARTLQILLYNMF